MPQHSFDQPETPRDIALRAEAPLVAGISSVQRACGRGRSPAGIESSELFSHGLNSLADFERILEPRMQSSFEQYVQAATKNEIVDHALGCIATSPLLEYPGRLGLVDVWIDSASTGPGKAYPAQWIARRGASSILTDLKNKTYDDPRHLDEIITTLDERSLMVKVLRAASSWRTVWRGNDQK